MLRIALTGGIGSGKSTVSRLFHELGIAVIDADQIARQLLTDDTALQQQVVHHFGQVILDQAGQLDRAKLRDIILHQRREKIWLEHLLHPAITRRMTQLADQVSSPYCLLDIPLLYETKQHLLYDRTLVIDTTEATQINRVHQRDHLSRQLIEQIMSHQATRAQRLSIADDVIHNDGSLAELSTQVDRLHQQYLALAANHS